MVTGAVTVRRVVREAAERLERSGVPEPIASADVLLSELLDVRRGEIPLYDEPVTPEQLALYEAWVSRRERREPVQRILGYAYFRNLKLELGAETLIPRPDTESVVEVALELIDRRGGRSRVLDVGTGSGAIAISIARERPHCEVHATDDSEPALNVARRNATASGTMVRFHHTDLVSGVELSHGKFELLISNPPYVETGALECLAPEVRDWDAHAALDGGPDGLAFFRRIFEETPPLLVEGADVVLEVGDGQAGKVLEVGEEAGFIPVGARPDLAGTPRAVLLRWEKG